MWVSKSSEQRSRTQAQPRRVREAAWCTPIRARAPPACASTRLGMGSAHRTQPVQRAPPHHDVPARTFCVAARGTQVDRTGRRAAYSCARVVCVCAWLRMVGVCVCVCTCVGVGVCVCVSCGWWVCVVCVGGFVASKHGTEYLRVYYFVSKTAKTRCPS